MKEDSVGKSPNLEVGMIDYLGREVLHISKNLAILLNKRGNLEITKIYGVTNVIIQNKPTIIFRMLNIAIPFSLKAGGKQYACEGKETYKDRYKFDYNAFGNLMVTRMYKDEIRESELFMTKLHVFLVRRKRDKKRKEIRDERKVGIYGRKIKKKIQPFVL